MSEAPITQAELRELVHPHLSELVRTVEAVDVSMYTTSADRPCGCCSALMLVIPRVRTKDVRAIEAAITQAIAGALGVGAEPVPFRPDR